MNKEELDFILQEGEGLKIEGLYRREIPEYPTEAVREAILNAMMHRDYNHRGGNVQVDIFDDRMTVTSIGGLLKPVTKENLGTVAARRNPLIADPFHRIHFVEKMGTGIKRIRDECREHGNVKFKFETNGYFITVFKLKKADITVRELTPQKTPQKTPQESNNLKTSNSHESQDKRRHCKRIPKKTEAERHPEEIWRQKTRALGSQLKMANTKKTVTAILLAPAIMILQGAMNTDIGGAR